MPDRQWDDEIDVLVVGSGAAGLSAAVVAASGPERTQVLVIEKSALLGGTSATSGAGVWIPCSPLAAEAGYPDTPEEAFAYLRALTAPNVSDERIDAYVRSAPAMLNWFARHTTLRFESMPYPDYHPDLQGGKPGWRTHFPIGMDGRLLGRDVDLIRAPSPAASLLGLICWEVKEAQTLLFRPRGWLFTLLGLLLRYALDVPQRLHSRKDRRLTLGNALIGRLMAAAKEKGVVIQRETALQELLLENGRVSGALISHEGRTRRVKTRRGVMLAGGGFERNAAMRAAYLPPQAGAPELSGSQPNNTGDCIEAALRAGAATRNMDSAWWGPVFKVPGEERGRLCAIERALPGCIMVNHAGRRFMNEATSYHIAAQRMLAEDRPDARTVPAYILFDASYRARYPMGPLLPVPWLFNSRAVRSTVTRADTIEELARKLGLPADALKDTIASFNADARTGNDSQFGRGTDVYERYYGDARAQPNPTMAPLERAPFYAMPMYLGEIGTNGGLATDGDARVLDAAGVPIAGLYAAGNTTASVMGYSYPAAGATLGPALTFGYVAGLQLGKSCDG